MKNNLIDQNIECKICHQKFKSKAELSRHRKENKHYYYHSTSKKLTEEEKKVFRIKLFKGWKASNYKNTGRASTPEKEELRKKKISETMKKNKRCGGYRIGSGRGKEGWYKGYWCDSSWELAYTIYNIDHNIRFKRYQGYFEYQFNDQTFKYYPDYILSDGTIVEIKGRDQDPQWKAKVNQFPKNIKL